MDATNMSVALRAIGCRRCDADAGVRVGREFLCGSCAIDDLGTDLEPPVVLCDVCQRDSTLRLDERFLCGRCALAMLCVDAEADSDLVRGFSSALSSAIVGQREPAIAWVWQVTQRTRDGTLGVADASAAYHRALAGCVEDASRGAGPWLEAGTTVFGAYAAAVDGQLEGVIDEAATLRAERDGLRRQVDELRREREETTARLRRAEGERGALVRHLTSAKEEERSRIAEEIHDDTVQTLVAVQMRLQILGAQAARKADAESLAELARITASSIGRLRTLMFELRADLLDRYGLVSTLRELLGRTEEQFGVAFRLEERLVHEPAPDVRANVYRIAQEAITNVRKHARAKHVRVGLEEREDGVGVTVQDDGCGFDVEASPSLEHAGLRFMRDRAERAGGWVRITSTEGLGTRVEAWIPNSVGGAR
jgi:signal transduction histidine kinase